MSHRSYLSAYLLPTIIIVKTILVLESRSILPLLVLLLQSLYYLQWSTFSRVLTFWKETGWTRIEIIFQGHPTDPLLLPAYPRKMNWTSRGCYWPCFHSVKMTPWTCNLVNLEKCLPQNLTIDDSNGSLLDDWYVENLCRGWWDHHHQQLLRFIFSSLIYFVKFYCPI